ncbi:PREDICTED: AP-3 complex subunit delta-like [Camelina sativa]|uniref:AP-3 complex subunit delta-like n=1 Tax=Camelina sativa TaxID=90675 RepID=A0ABM1R2H7_CAMSA|nr:PREDICTED: AP-3 complex subunit delta-like [Camelina sativa]
MASSNSLMDSLFQRSLEDLIKGIRLQLHGDSSFISKSLDEICREIKSTDLSTKSIISEASGVTLLRKKYFVDFFGEEFTVAVTSDSSVIGHDVLFHNRFSSHPLVVGVGVQWTPPGYYSDFDSSLCGYYDPPADTLQLCVGNRCIIIQLSHCNRLTVETWFRF